jgi:secreted PhoX family phosphatase
LAPVADKRDGVVRLHLPRGFVYRSFDHTNVDVMSDGVVVPPRHDGMAAFPAGPGRVRLVRNHEVNNPGTPIGEPARAYDPMARGGTSTIEIRARAAHVRSWVSLNGTQMNCAGGGMPWGSWITCEETVNGPDVGPDFTGEPNDPLHQKHGYIFDVPSSRGPGEYAPGDPIRAAGRFAHEAVTWTDGHLYLTEDDFAFPSGFYRYGPPADPMSAGRLLDGGTLEMLRVVGSPDIELAFGQPQGVTYDVDWVPIPDPDPNFPPGTTNDEAIQAVAQQGFDQGAARWSRLEGIHSEDGIVYIVSTQGGEAPGSPPGGYGDGAGQVWALDVARQELTLVFDSPDRSVLELPDNVTVTPRGSLLLCEDGPVENFLRGLTPNGAIFDFALNTVPGREREEFAGATYSPDGKVLFVNMQSEEAITFAIWGPWARGDL